jgi:hypothetical protein
MPGTPGKKGKRARKAKFTDPLVVARRNLATEINKCNKKLRHWIKRGMSPSRESYMKLQKHITRLESHLGSIQKSRTSSMSETMK